MDLRRAAQASREAETTREQYERELRQLRADRSDTLNRAKTEASDIVRKTRMEMDRIQQELRRLEKDARKAAAEPGNPEAIQKLRERLARTTGRAEQREEKVERRLQHVPRPAPPVETGPQMDRRPPTPGDLVWIEAFNQQGTLLGEPEGGKANVQVGAMRITVPYDSLRRIMAQKGAVGATARVGAPAGGQRADLRMQARANVSPEVSLRGMRADEAMIRLDEYIDEVCLAGLSPVRVVHGKGTGALKKVVWEYLQKQPQVSGFHHPPEEEGGSGVTIVELRE